VGFANLQGLEISTKEASTKGRRASALCRNLGIERIHDPRFGKVGLYPESVLIEVFSTDQN
jgi:DNA-damage-inducible protein D